MGVTRPSKGTYFHGYASYPWIFMIHGYDATQTAISRLVLYTLESRQWSNAIDSHSLRGRQHARRNLFRCRRFQVVEPVFEGSKEPYPPCLRFAFSGGHRRDATFLNFVCIVILSKHTLLSFLSHDKHMRPYPQQSGYRLSRALQRPMISNNPSCFVSHV